MKKLVAVGAMLAMMVVAVSPASAQAIGGDVDLDFVDASQVQAAAAFQVNEGDATADASGVGSAAAAEISQDLSIDQTQVNGGFDDFDDDFVIVVF